MKVLHISHHLGCMRDHAYIYHTLGFQYEFWKFYSSLFKITKDIEALRDSLKTPEVSKKEDKIESVFDGLSDMFSTKQFDEQSEAAKNSKKELDTTEFKLFNGDLRQYKDETYKKIQKDKEEREGRVWVGNRAKLIQDLRN